MAKVELRNDCTKISGLARARVGKELKAAKERGEVARAGQYERTNVPSGNVSPATHAEIGITRKQAR